MRPQLHLRRAGRFRRVHPRSARRVRPESTGSRAARSKEPAKARARATAPATRRCEAARRPTLAVAIRAAPAHASNPFDAELPYDVPEARPFFDGSPMSTFML